MHSNKVMQIQSINGAYIIVEYFVALCILEPLRINCIVAEYVYALIDKLSS